MFRKIASSLCFMLFLGLIVACSPNSLLHPNKNESSNKRAESKPGEIGKPVALPPRFGTEPLKQGANNSATSPNGLPVLSPKGINVDTIFSQDIRNTNDRFDRVENAVIDLKKEFESYKPAIVRLAAVESDIQNLIQELEVLLEEPPASPNQSATLDIQQLNPTPIIPPTQLSKPKPPTQKTAKAKAPPPKKPPTPAKTYKDTVGVGLRVADHKDKTRVVIDLNRKTPHTIDLDNNEKILIVELPEARWVGNKEHKFVSSPVLSKLEVEPINNGAGSLIIFTLKKSTQIKQKNILAADKKHPYHRIYFDLQP